MIEFVLLTMEGFQLYLAKVPCVNIIWKVSLSQEEIQNMTCPYAGLREIYEFQYMKNHGFSQTNNICLWWCWIGICRSLSESSRFLAASIYIYWCSLINLNDIRRRCLDKSRACSKRTANFDLTASQANVVSLTKTMVFHILKLVYLPQSCIWARHILDFFLRQRDLSYDVNTGDFREIQLKALHC